MNIIDIHDQKWNVSPDMKITKNAVKSLEKEEQELHINSMKSGMEDADKEEMTIDCSYQKYMSRLAKSEFFTLTEVLISSNSQAEGFILEVSGILEPRGLTIRKVNPYSNTDLRNQMLKRMQTLRKKLPGRI